MTGYQAMMRYGLWLGWLLGGASLAAFGQTDTLVASVQADTADVLPGGLGAAVRQWTDTAVLVERREWRVGQREMLPHWMFTPSGEGHVVAVSDPGLAQEAARRQVLLRAAFLLALRQGIRVEAVTDYFSFTRQQYEYEHTGDKLVTMLRVEGVLPAVAWQSGREHVTQYGELIAECLPDSVCRDSCIGRFTGELLLVSSGELSERNELRCEWKMSRTCPDGQLQCAYSLKGDSRDLKVSSVMNGTVLDVPFGGCWYADSDEKTDETDAALNEGSTGPVEGYLMNRSLWCAKMESLLYALIGHEWPRLQMKNLDEEWESDGRGLKREVIRGQVAVSGGGCGIMNNRLLMEWQLSDLPRETGCED